MKYAEIREVDISNGKGIRTSIFVQGCTHNCIGCFNPETHDFKGGTEYTEVTQNALFGASEPSYIHGLSILGGEPLHPLNTDYVGLLAHDFKVRFPNKDIWLWTGYEFEDIKDRAYHVLVNIDVLVDGLFVEELKDSRLKYCGSSNQRVINVKESLKQDKVILLSTH